MTTINYLELPAPELAATKAFYTSVFGWEWIDYGPSYAGTANHGDHGVEIGLNGLAIAGPAHADGEENVIGAFALVSTDDLTGAETRVKDAGGTVVSGPYPYPGGNRFHFRDPSGNILAIFQPDS